jgi:hypothetical protein
VQFTILSMCSSHAHGRGLIVNMTDMASCCSYIYETERNAPELILPQYRAARAHFPAKEILSVADYRARHNQYSALLLEQLPCTHLA